MHTRPKGADEARIIGLFAQRKFAQRLLFHRMKYWEIPPLIKVYEALGCLGDERMEMVDGVVKVFSSSKNKTYGVWFDEKSGAIMTNDNGSFWQGYLGYPAIALLMTKKILSFDKKWGKALEEIDWKGINTRNKNDWNKTLVEVDKIVKKRGFDPKKLRIFCEKVVDEIEDKKFLKLGKRKKPPKGY